MVISCASGARLLLMLLLLCLISTGALAEIRASVDRTQLQENETLTLTLRVWGDADNEPDFGVLAQDFQVLNRRESRSDRDPGSSEGWRAWTLTLEPRRSGSLELPALQVGDQASDPVRIRVDALDPRARQFIDDQLYFETDLSDDQVYVQAQLLFTRKLVYGEGVNLFGELPGHPRIEHALVQPLGEADIRSEYRDGQRYRIIHQRYAIFPERSGELVIPSASMRGSAIMPSRLGFSGRRVPVNARTGDIRIPVKPIPSDWPAGTPWLPAADLELMESWSGDSQRVNDQSATSRALLVRAEGAMASMIPPLRPEAPDSLRVYEQRP